MPLCQDCGDPPDRCGCNLIDGFGTSVSGTGEPGDPWQVDSLIESPTGTLNVITPGTRGNPIQIDLNISPAADDCNSLTVEDCGAGCLVLSAGAETALSRSEWIDNDDFHQNLYFVNGIAPGPNNIPTTPGIYVLRNIPDRTRTMNTATFHTFTNTSTCLTYLVSYYSHMGSGLMELGTGQEVAVLRRVSFALDGDPLVQIHGDPAFYSEPDIGPGPHQVNVEDIMERTRVVPPGRTFRFSVQTIVDVITGGAASGTIGIDPPGNNVPWSQFTLFVNAEAIGYSKAGPNFGDDGGGVYPNPPV